MVVYADILICVNLIVNYFLLLATAHFCQRKVNRLRLLLAALLGALYAMVLFVPMPPWALMVSRLGASSLILLAALKWVSMAQYLKEYVIFFVVNFVFAGLMLALWLWVAPKGMIFNNGVVYFDINALTLVVFTAVAYGICELFTRLYRKQKTDGGLLEVRLELGGNQVLLTGFLDTGNTLKDAYTGYPVVICTLEAVRPVLPQNLAAIFENPLDDGSALERMATAGIGSRFKLIPYSTVGFSGVLPAFLPDRMSFKQEGKHYEIENVYVAVSPRRLSQGSYDVLLNAEMVALERGMTAAKIS